jgi:hypothetical protein
LILLVVPSNQAAAYLSGKWQTFNPIQSTSLPFPYPTISSNNPYQNDIVGGRINYPDGSKSLCHDRGPLSFSALAQASTIPLILGWKRELAKLISEYCSLNLPISRRSPPSYSELPHEDQRYHPRQTGPYGGLEVVEFAARCPLDVQKNIRIVAVCGIPVPDAAPQDYG